MYLALLWAYDLLDQMSDVADAVKDAEGLPRLPARERARRQEFRSGTLSGLEGLDNRPLSRIGGKLADASAALTNAVASIETPVASMQKWAHALEHVRRAGGDLDRHVYTVYR